jgi:hypothetical protein
VISLRCNHVIRAIIGQPQPSLTLQTPSKPTQSLGIPANTMSKQLPHAIPPGQLAPTKSTIPPKPTKAWPFLLVSTALDVVSKPAASNMQHSPDEMIRRRVQCSAPMRETTGQAYRTRQSHLRQVSPPQRSRSQASDHTDWQNASEGQRVAYYQVPTVDVPSRSIIEV